MHPVFRWRAHIGHLPRLASALLSLCLLSGCGFFYEHRIKYPDFALYGDHGSS